MKESPYDQHILQLADKWLNGTITSEEEKEFAQWYNQFDDEAALSLHAEFAEDEAVLKRRIYEVLDKRMSGAVVRPVAAVRAARFRWMAAAVFTGLLIGGTLLFIANRSHSGVGEGQLAGHDLPPGGNKAVLTLAGGQKLILDNIPAGTLADQGVSKIVKQDSGRLVYEPAGDRGEEAGTVTYNTLTTPRGGQYQLVLPDGTKVWLNAASSIYYPTVFVGKERRVEITGEAYFEVKQNARAPFIVHVNSLPGNAGGSADIKVLGTHFNINAYGDEPAVKATLLEGAVKVSGNAWNALLSPGQQASIARASGTNRVSSVDVEEVVAWKNGLFQFNNADLQALMRQLGRWYDVDVVYEGNIPVRKFEGEIQRDLNLSDVLEALGKNRVHFKIEGKKLIVLP